MVSAINVRAKEKGTTWTDVINEKQKDGKPQIEGIIKGPDNLAQVNTHTEMAIRLMAKIDY